MLTVESCERMALQTLGNPGALPSEFSALDLVNRAGRWLCTAHPWNWLNRLDTLDVTGGQLFVPLTSLGAVTAILAVQFSDQSSFYLRETTLSNILDKRTGQTPSGDPTYFALNDQIAADGSLTKVLELDSSPTDDISDGITIHFRAGFQIPQGGAASARIAVPDEWEGLFLLAVRAVARGYHHEDDGTGDARLTALKRSDEFQDLKRMDGMRQSNYGPLTGGGVEMQMMALPELRYPRSPG